MIIPSKGDAVFWIWTFGVLSSLLISTGFGYTLGTPLNTMRIYDDRAKRSPSTVCVEIKPNGPLEEPYYMCKKGDFPTFPKQPEVSNLASPSSGNSVQPSAANFAQNNYQGPVPRGVADSGTMFQNFANSASQDGHGLFPTQPNSNFMANPQLQNKPSAENRRESFRDQIPTAGFYERSTEQNEKPFQPIAHQQQYQPHHQQHDQHQPFHHRQQQHSVIQPAKSHQSPFQNKEQFFRPETASNEKPDGYEAIYADNGSRAANPQHASFKPLAAHSTQHSASFSSYPAAPTYQSVFLPAATGGPSFTSPVDQRFNPTQQAFPGAADCVGDCGGPANQVTPPNDATQNGPNQYAVKPPIHDAPYGTHGFQPFATAGNHFQNPLAQISGPAAISTGMVQNPPSFSNANDSPPRAPPSPPIRYGDNGAAAFTARDGSSVPHLGPNDTPPFGSAFLGPARSAEFHPSETSFSDDALSTRQRQAAYRQQFETDKNNKYSRRFNPQRQQAQTLPPAQRYRSGIDDEVLEMPNWGFSTDELNLYRSISSEEEDTSPALTGMPLPLSARRVVPLEHLDDPVMRTFYSSLDDVGPLPVFSPASLPSNLHLPSRRIPYQPNCMQQPAPQYYNYNPCIPQRAYSVQPIFIALPCFGSSMYPNLGSPAPATITGNTMTTSLGSTQSEVLRQAPLTPVQTEVRLGDARKIESVENFEDSTTVHKELAASTTLAPTTDDDSNESAESLENSTPTTTKVSQSKPKSDESTEPSEIKPTSTQNTHVEVQTTTASPASLLGSAILSTTAKPPTTTDSVLGQVNSEMSTTFKSLIINARRLAHAHNLNTSQERDDVMPKFKISTQKPKRQTQRGRYLQQ